MKRAKCKIIKNIIHYLKEDIEIGRSLKIYLEDFGIWYEYVLTCRPDKVHISFAQGVIGGKPILGEGMVVNLRNTKSWPGLLRMKQLYWAMTNPRSKIEREKITTETDRSNIQ